MGVFSDSESTNVKSAGVAAASVDGTTSPFEEFHNLQEHAPLIPVQGPYWDGSETRVPDPATIAESAHLSSMSYAGSQLWAALCGTAAAQLIGSNAAREEYASHRRSKAWTVGFCDANPVFFSRNPSGARTPHQFFVGLWAVPAIRQYAIAAAFPGVPPTWFPWYGWGPDAALAERSGFCYLRLIHQRDRGAMCLALGAWPTADAVADHIRHHGLAWPGRFYASFWADGLRAHVHDSDEPGGTPVMLPGDPVGLKSCETPLLGSVCLGAGEQDVLTPVVTAAGGGNTLRVRVVFGATVNTTVPLGELPAIAPYVANWRSVKLTGITAQVSGTDADAALYVGLSSPARRALLPLGTGTTVEAVLAADAYVAIDGVSAGAGRQQAELDLTPLACDLELSASRPPADAYRPDLSVVFVPAAASYATLVLIFRIGGGALLSVAPNRFFATATPTAPTAGGAAGSRPRG
jgi:hypothetical protein